MTTYMQNGPPQTASDHETLTSYHLYCCRVDNKKIKPPANNKTIKIPPIL